MNTVFGQLNSKIGQLNSKIGQLKDKYDTENCQSNTKTNELKKEYNNDIESLKKTVSTIMEILETMKQT